MSPSHFNHTMTFSDNIDEANGAYYVVIPRPTGWTHGVLVYHGVGMGITAYLDGIEVGADTVK